MKTIKPKPKLNLMLFEKMKLTSTQMKRIKGGDDTVVSPENPIIIIKE